jgi:hypothetical protein
MTDCEQITMEQVNAWHYVNMSHMSDTDCNRMIAWLEQQPGNRFYWSLTKKFWFESEQDRMMCVISWT